MDELAMLAARIKQLEAQVAELKSRKRDLVAAQQQDRRAAVAPKRSAAEHRAERHATLLRRLASIAADCDSGLGPTALAAKHGVGVERARQLRDKAMRYRQNGLLPATASRDGAAP